MFLFWGPELICFYNDAYMPSFGHGKHPSAMGMRGKDVFAEIWTIIHPQIQAAMTHGEASWNVDQLVPIHRNGRLEEVYWTYSYSPVYGEDGQAAGTFVTCTETTSRVLQERRERTVRALIERAGRAADLETTRQAILETSRDNPSDIPFVRIHEDVRTDLPAFIEGPLPTYTVPLSSGVVTFGLSARLPFDADYRQFLTSLVSQLELAIQVKERESYFRTLDDTSPAMLWITQGDGSCSYLSKHWFDFTGRTRDQDLGFGWLENVHPDDRDEAKQTFLDANSRQAPFSILHRLRRHDGQYRWVFDAGEPRLGSDGRFLGCLLYTSPSPRD